jgi:hypothetical protein
VPIGFYPRIWDLLERVSTQYFWFGLFGSYLPDIISSMDNIGHSKIHWYPKLFQRENALSLFLSAESLGNSTKTLPGNDKT